MSTDPYYRTKEWLALRAACLKRDGYRCAVPGCVIRASHADHIVSRKKGGADHLSNLRSYCQPHHSTKTAQADGGFGRPAQPVKLAAKGCDASGTPRDPNHPWHRARG